MEDEAARTARRVLSPAPARSVLLSRPERAGGPLFAWLPAHNSTPVSRLVFRSETDALMGMAAPSSFPWPTFVAQSDLACEVRPPAPCRGRSHPEPALGSRGVAGRGVCHSPMALTALTRAPPVRPCLGV